MHSAARAAADFMICFLFFNLRSDYAKFMQLQDFPFREAFSSLRALFWVPKVLA
jgi:hypothetical protein